MLTRIFFLKALPGLVLAGMTMADTALLEASAGTVKAAVTPLADGIDYVYLPALEIDFVIRAACPADAKPESLSVSVADTRKSFAADEIDGLIETSLELPRRQSIHLKVEEFCRDSGARDAPVSRVVTDVLTARLSLRCSEEGSQSIVYTILPLDVELQCESGEEPKAQDVSASESDANF